VSIRVGLGVDAHRFGGDGPLWLGTIAVEHPHGLVGHSDGDVVAHAVCDALLAAAGLPDIGAHFPPGDPKWAGVSGAHLLELTGAEIGRAGASAVNVHAVVICEAPRIGPHREAMQVAMSRAVGADVSVAATTTERMGFTGRGEGVACEAVALVEMS
jgi:2-C-methyl-D-erythritol 4-phosphate cytidylyltransferase/2-C-methyl-D-erythritol 2,4-cyclodiphosphate synthase